MYMTELLGLLTLLGLLKLWHLIYPRLLTGFSILVFFTNLRLVEFQVKYLALFLPFKLKTYGISGQIFGLISSFPSNRQLGVGLDGTRICS